ncbi:MAG TPA: hypothetical protein VLT62_10790 [Candidatus Methylomirabilis sp.]|nr:hypothetical protein [Candidatus Methylomirabilis sp.]
MRIRRRALAACLVLLPVLGLAAWMTAPAGQTWLELTDAGTGRRILSQLLPPGERVVLTWRNSLFGLPVTEVFVAGAGILTLTQITFADPTGRESPRVKPADVDDLYQTGGPFRAEGLSRPVKSVVFRVGEIGNPAIQVGNRLVRFTEEVGFGGAVRLTARGASPYESISGWLLGW